MNPWILFFCACVFPKVGNLKALEPNNVYAVYEPVSGIAGDLNAIGSDTLNNLMTLLAERFQEIYPSVGIGIEGKGSSSSPPALINGTAQLGPMSRQMKPSEEDHFEARYGYKPTQVIIALDALAIFVHKDNPLEYITLKQLDGIFSNTYKREERDIHLWGELGLTDERWRSRQISLYGRNSASGTYGFFRSQVLLSGDYKPNVKEQPGSSAVVQGVGSDLYSMGYSDLSYKTSEVKALAVGRESMASFLPTYENTLSGDYPLSRALYIYVNKPPREGLDKLTLEFLKFILSSQGQEIVAKNGYFPIPPVEANLIVKDLERIHKK